jgi:pilus assembly protein Flp/PilA
MEWQFETVGYPGQRLCINIGEAYIWRGVNTHPEERIVKANALRALRSLHSDESGQDLLEHALLAALIALKVAMAALASNIDHAFSAVGSALSNAFSIHH